MTVQCEHPSIMLPTRAEDIAPDGGKCWYRSIWISDVHLGSRDCQAKQLNRFLKKTHSEFLYIVGDFIDLWQLKKRWYWPKRYNTVIQKILKKARKGTKVIFVPGNHDEGFRNFVGYQFGEVEITSRTVHRTASGQRFLVLHGDEFDLAVHTHPWIAHIGSWAYDYLVLMNSMINRVRSFLGKPYWSFSGYVKCRVKNAVKFITSFEEIVARHAVDTKVDGVICGHIHQPNIATMQNVTYANCGDWVENCSALVEHADGRLELTYWTAEDAAGEDSSDPELDEDPYRQQLAKLAEQLSA